MDLRQRMERLFVDRTVSELQLANSDTYQSVTYNSLLYLDLIAYTPDCTAGYLAETLHVAPSAITSKVRELERLGLVTRTRSERENGSITCTSTNSCGPSTAPTTRFSTARWTSWRRATRRSRWTCCARCWTRSTAAFSRQKQPGRCRVEKRRKEKKREFP